MNANDFRKQLRHDDIVAAIGEAERRTSGEIRVFISQKAIENPLAAAQTEFERLGMTKTRERNGVLIFVAPRTHKFAVIGDEGIHQRCGNEFWQNLTGEMAALFKQSEFSQGIVHAIRKAGEQLAQHFPCQPDDRNELPNDVSSG